MVENGCLRSVRTDFVATFVFGIWPFDHFYLSKEVKIHKKFTIIWPLLAIWPLSAHFQNWIWPRKNVDLTRFLRVRGHFPTFFIIFTIN